MAGSLSLFWSLGHISCWSRKRPVEEGKEGRRSNHPWEAEEGACENNVKVNVEISVNACQVQVVDHQVDEWGKHHGTQARATRGNSHGEAKSTAEEMVDYVHSRQVHHAKAKTSQKTDCDVKYHERSVVEHLIADNVVTVKYIVTLTVVL